MTFHQWLQMAKQKFGEFDLRDMASALSAPWMEDAIEKYRLRLWALWAAAYQLPAEPLPYREPQKATEGGSDLEPQPASGRVIDLETVSVSPGSYTTAYLSTIKDTASFPPGAPISLPDRLTDGKTALHMHFLGLLPVPGAGMNPAFVKRLIAGFEAVHAIWESIDEAQRIADDLTHPLAALIQGWMNARPVKPDRRETGIIPNAARVQRVEVLPSDSGTLFDLDAWTPTPDQLGPQIDASTQAYLPGLKPNPSVLEPALPLYLYDGAGGVSKQKGGGAHLALRVWVELVTAVPVDMRETEQRLEFALWEYKDWLWPNGWSRYHQLPRLRRAMAEVDRMRLTVNLPNGGRTAWRVVGFLGMFPPKARLEDRAIAQVNLPPGSGHGPMVHRPTLRRLGLENAAQYRAALGMAYHWWDQAVNGRYIRPYRKRLARDQHNQPIRRVVKKDAFGKEIASWEPVPDGNGNPIRQLMIGKGDKRRPHPDLVWLDADDNRVPYDHATLEKNPTAWGTNGKKGYPIIGDDDLVRLFHMGAKRRSFYQRKHEAADELQAMAEAGLCVIDAVDGGWRIMPPQSWGPRGE